MPDYELKSLKLPKLTGMMLKIFTAAVENPVSRMLLLGGLLENGGIPKLRRQTLDEPPTLYPLLPAEKKSASKVVPFKPGAPPKGFPYLTAGDYVSAYRQGKLTPVDVAERVLAAIEESEQGEAPLRTFVAIKPEDVISQARASAERYRARKPFGPLDGVPVAVKDEMDMVPYPTTVGTSFLGKQPAAQDSTMVARLRSAGALLVGKTNMHEIGINPNGCNVHHGSVRNPYDVRRDTGGSSSGSAAAVAAGLVPMATGADGGGSIRIPATLCGIVGLKPTFGRISEAGVAPLCWSVAHIGPLAASVEDAGLMYAVTAGPDPLDPNSQVQPPVTLADWNRQGLKGLRIGIYRDWFEHALPQVVSICEAMVVKLKFAGAEVHEIAIQQLDEMRIAHAITILSEIAVCMHANRSQRKQHGAAVRLSLVLGDEFTASDYLQAQRMRTRTLAIFNDIFRQVDLILTPGTALPAQPIPAGGLSSGWSDLATDTEMMRFIFPPNLAGHPAISFPAGYDEEGIPVGLQVIGRHWEEHLLLRVAYNAEHALERRTPDRYYRIL